MASEQAALAVNAWEGQYLDTIHRQWQADPNSVEPHWRDFFRGFELGSQLVSDIEPAATGSTALPARDYGAASAKQNRVDTLMYHYRDIGHLAADLDPLGTKRPFPANLELASFDLSEADLDERFDPGIFPIESPVKLRDLIAAMHDTYCGHIGVEYMHIQDRQQRRWLQKQMEPSRNKPHFTRDEKLRILKELNEADSLEQFLNTRYKAKKRFSLEGADSLNAMLNDIVERAPEHGIRELTIGMAHRGRINVLVNVLQKTYDQLFSEFEEAWVEDFVEGGGDVKYHRGYSSDHITQRGDSVRLVLSPNPSHLEHVNPVVLGRARAKQRLRRDTERKQCVPILIHGDASFPAQGVVAEALNMSKLDGYTVGGSIHIIVNNQVGFTTNPSDAHSGDYCTDIAKMVSAPIFHVNGDDPEACVFAALIALEYRQTFKRDVVIDMWCYRKFGHNESDEPAFTQPLMYQRVSEKRPVVDIYVDQLIKEGHITREQYDAMAGDLRTKLDEAQTRTKEKPVASTVQAFQSAWAGLVDDYNDNPVETGVSLDVLKQVSKGLGTTPKDFNLHKKLSKLQTYRKTAIDKNEPVDWGLGEVLAYGTLLLEGHAVRLTGQDVERGTFSHRHAVLFDQKDGSSYEPLNNIAAGQAKFCIHNSPLTESACVGFEYGYSLGDPNMLVIWEAQFGDFCNTAQVYYDQFLSSAETKWQRQTGLTLFLPHGYEGAGPEHSSARLERFLTLCAKNNMQVVYPTSPAQHFHMLRRQLKRNFRKPLIVMTPKSLLRNPRATSTADEFVKGRFEHVIDDATATDAKKISRLIFCTGKVYYDLIDHREKTDRDDIAVVRIEQLYPLRLESLKPLLKKYAKAEKFWVQEEPRNMGAWRYMDSTLREKLDLELAYIGREENSSPAVASEKMHRQEQEKIMISAIGLAAAQKKDAAA